MVFGVEGGYGTRCLAMGYFSIARSLALVYTPEVGPADADHSPSHLTFGRCLDLPATAEKQWTSFPC